MRCNEKEKESEIEKERRLFRNELRGLIRLCLDKINHYISGVDSPFSYMQIQDVQESLREIGEVIGKKEDGWHNEDRDIGA